MAWHGSHVAWGRHGRLIRLPSGMVRTPRRAALGWLLGSHGLDIAARTLRATGVEVGAAPTTGAARLAVFPYGAASSHAADPTMPSGPGRAGRVWLWRPAGGALVWSSGALVWSSGPGVVGAVASATGSPVWDRVRVAGFGAQRRAGSDCGPLRRVGRRRAGRHRAGRVCRAIAAGWPSPGLAVVERRRRAQTNHGGPAPGDRRELIPSRLLGGNTFPLSSRQGGKRDLPARDLRDLVRDFLTCGFVVNVTFVTFA